MKRLLFILGCLSFFHGQAQKPQLVIPSGHYSFVDGLAISPDGRYVLSGGADGRVKLWNFDGKELKTLRYGHNEWVTALAFSPNSEFILAGGMVGKIKGWSLDGELVFDFAEGAGQEVLALSVSDKLEALAVVSQGVIRLGPEANITGFAAFEAEASLKEAVFSPGQGRILGYSGTQAYILDTAGVLLHHFPLEENIVSVSWIASEGALFATPERVLLWEMESNAVEEISIKAIAQEATCTFALLSPNLQYLAIGLDFYDNQGNYYGSNVTLMDVETGESTTINTPQWVYKGAFSRDSQRFLFLDWSANEDQIFSRLQQYTSSGEKLAEYGIGGLAEAFNGLSILPDGQHLLSVHSDSTLKVWDLRSTRPAILSQHQQSLLSLDVSTDGKAIMAVEGYALQFHHTVVNRKIEAVQLMDERGGLLHRLSGPVVAQWADVALSPDGQSLLALDTAGRLGLLSLDGELLRSYTYEPDGTPVAFLHFIQSPDGQYILASSRESDLAVLWYRDGKLAHAFTPEQAGSDRGKPSCLAFSPNGQAFLVGYDAAPGAFLWNVEGELLAGMGWPDPAFTTAVCFSADGRQVAIGRNDGKAGAWDTEGKELFQLNGHEGLVSAIHAIPGTDYLVTASQDESLKFWNLKTGRELAQLASLGGTERVALAPNGLFDASPMAMEWMYYSLGLETIELDQLKERYYEPNLLPRLLGLAEGSIRDVQSLQNLPLFPKVKARIEGDTLFISLEERTGGLGKVAISVGKNKEIIADANPERRPSLAISLAPFAPYFLPGQDNLLNIRAYNADSWMRSEPYILAYRPEAADKGVDIPAFQPGPDQALEEIDLYAVIVGTSEYRGAQLNLNYPDRDAAMIAQALQEAGKPLFGERLHIQLLTTDSDEPPRKGRLRQVFQAFAQQAGPEDILLIYLSGHGITYPPNSEQGQFYYLTTDIASDKLDDPAILQQQAIAQDTLLAWLRDVRARKQVLILDACQSGRVVDRLEAGQRMLNPDQERALERMKDRSGLFILAGSAANKSAFEASRFGHGLLTYSLLRNMPVAAARNHNFVDVGQLFALVREDVPRLAEEIGEVQEPELIGSSSFDIGIVDESVRLPKVEAKPVFTRCSFELEEEPLDRINLGESITRKLERYASGRKPSIVYLDLLSFPGAYRLRGRYEMAEGTVSVKVWLYQGDELATKFTLDSPEEAVDGLAEGIIGQAFRWLEGKRKEGQ